ncbi:MAG: hypothetical protein ABI353_02280 [Isosphaeraceae bacterium]
MLLRLAMVSAVACLGFDLPTENDLQSWTRTGQVWWDATTAQWVMPSTDLAPDAVNEPEEPPDHTAPAPESVVETTPTTTDEPATPIAETLTDQAFDSVVTQMVSTFATDATPLPTVAALETPSFEPVEVGDDLYPGLAYELNRASEGTPLPAQAVALAAPAPTPEQPEAETSSPGERLATAVRLTNQAVSAWVGLLRHDVMIVSSHE